MTMGKKSGEAAPAGVVKATKPLKKDKREPEDGDLQTKTNLKKQKKDVDVDDRLQRLESKFDILVTKLDLLISATGNRDHVKKLVKAKAAISSSDDGESSSSDEDSEEKPTSSDSSDDDSDEEESDQGEKPEEKMAKADKKITKEESTSVDSSEKSDEKESEDRFGFAPGRFIGGPLGFRGRGRGRWPFGGRFVGGRCGGLGHCRRSC